jgi:peptidoglycan/LPS O-acetylase OafA/YrhL
MKYLLTFKKLISTHEIERISFRKDINILRAVAVIVVIFYHAEIKYFEGGWLGVDIFFVISGYLISNIIISDLNQNTFTFKNFYIKRIKRILPALISTMLMTIPFAYFLLSPLPMIEYGKSLISTLFFYSNYYFNSLDFYNAEPSKFFPLLHTWSLSIEEQFYILFPGFIFLIFKLNKSYIFAMTSSVFLISILINPLTGENEKFYLIQYRIWELLLGCLIMIISHNIKFRRFTTFGYILIAFSVTFFDDSFVNNIEPKFIATLGAVLIIISPSSQINFQNKIFLTVQKIGLASYSLYLLHQPIFAFSRILLKRYQIEENFLIVCLCFVILYLIANWNYKYIELKFINAESINLKYFAFVFPIFLFSFFINSTEGVTFHYEEVYSSLQKYYSEEQREGVKLESCNEISDFYCEVGKPNLPSIVLIGDSHLTTLSKYLYNNLNFDKYKLTIFLEQGCPFFLEGGKSDRGKCPDKEKAASVLSRIDKESIVIFGGRFPRYLNGFDFETNFGSINDDVEENPLLIKDIDSSIEFLSAKSETLILVYPIPELGLYPLEFYLNKLMKIDESLHYDRKYWEEYSSEINLYFDSVDLKNIEKIQSNDIFCNVFIPNMCTASLNKEMLYWDDDHLTYDGASYIGVGIFNIINNK